MMAGNEWWIRDEGGKKHPEDSVLLAYFRGQQLEDRKKIRRHIENEQCRRCQQKSNEFADASAKLEILAEMQTNQYYPELSAVHTYERIQQAVNRERQRRPSFRVVSLPAAFGLAALFTVVIIALASLGGWRSALSQWNLVTSGPPNVTGIKQHEITPVSAKPTAAVTVTLVPGMSSTPTTVRKGPYIAECGSTSAQSDINICGYEFTPGDKVVLYVYLPESKGLRQRGTAIVDDKGQFLIKLSINDCNNAPVAIYAHDLDKKVDSPTIENTAFGNCSSSGGTGTNPHL